VRFLIDIRRSPAGSNTELETWIFGLRNMNSRLEKALDKTRRLSANESRRAVTVRDFELQEPPSRLGALWAWDLIG
jgi:hypothetical protein